MNRFVLSGLALAAAIVSTSPSMAQDAPTMRVSFADLDLSAPAGAKTLDARLHSAVKAVCGEAEAADLTGLAKVGRCRRAAWDGAKAQVDRIYASRGGAPIVLAAK